MGIFSVKRTTNPIIVIPINNTLNNNCPVLIVLTILWIKKEIAKIPILNRICDKIIKKILKVKSSSTMTNKQNKEEIVEKHVNTI